ncbi:hypothetical protein ZWY2020_007781 [Hordeum vulgare]|nr:hypothetical protein ZWY2020_007781 [Hordeum vulgare]
MVSSTAVVAAEEDDDGNTRKLRLTKEQSALLEDRFKEHNTLNPKQKVALAKQLNLRPRQVEVWFQNRRASAELQGAPAPSSSPSSSRRRHRPTTRQPTAGPRPPPRFQRHRFTCGCRPPLTICPSCERLGGTAATAAGNGRPDRPKATHHFFNTFTHSAAC